MTTERDELLHLVQELPELQGCAALAAVRHHLRPDARPARPLAFFASAAGDGKSIADAGEELLREGCR